MPQWYLGTVGFSYKDWVGSFYPTGISPRGYLSYYCKLFNVVELNTTFHSVPNQVAVQTWYRTSPTDFQFCVKTPRRITHELGLKDAQGLMLEFIDSLHLLNEKLGPILIQLPPNYKQENYSILAEFLDSLPHGHRYAIEFRHLTWYNERTTKLLTEHRICWVSSDYPNLPKQIIPTAPFLYFRWIGINNTYHIHSYERVDKTVDLRWWINAITPVLNQVPIVYGFFNNDYAGFAAGTCKKFMQIAGLRIDDDKLISQERLF